MDTNNAAVDEPANPLLLFHPSKIVLDMEKIIYFVDDICKIFVNSEVYFESIY
jgi:hypothetical protein